MKDHFIRLFNYDHYANHKITQAILIANTPEKSVQLMAHLLTAEEVWLNRCLGKPATSVVLWPDGNASDFEQRIDEIHTNWLAYLDNLTDGDFNQQVSYANMAGDPFITRLDDILMHVINHGTHTRAQAGQHLKLEGIETLPPTDYIYYVRSLN